MLGAHAIEEIVQPMLFAESCHFLGETRGIELNRQLDESGLQSHRLSGLGSRATFAVRLSPGRRARQG
jgi:hypothetical protein